MEGSKALKTIILLVVIAYVISPVDFFPGPADDLLAIAAYAIGNIGSRNE